MKVFKKETISKYIPIIETLSNYKSRFFLMDFIAALTLVAITVPEAMAYAQIAGVPPEVGFYTIPLAMLGYAIFGSSRNVIVGTSSSVAVMSAVVIGTIAIKGTGEFLALTAALAIICGVIYLIFGLAKLGFISNFVSKPVVIGFIFGLALFIIMRQIPKILGISGTEGNFFEIGVQIINNLSSINWWAFLIGAFSLIILSILGRYVPRAPSALVILVLSILVVTFLNLESKGVHLIGSIPSALPKFNIPDVNFDDIIRLIPGAIGIVFVGYTETLGIAYNYGAKYHYGINPNQELIALGVANLGSGFSSGFVVSGSLSKSVDNDSAGAKSQLSPIIATVLIIIVVIWLTPLFHNLSEAALGALVIHAVWHMMKIRELRRIYKIKRVDFWLSFAALAGVLVFDILAGLAIAVIASMLAITIRTSKSNTALLGKVPDREVYTDIKRHPDNETVKGLIILRPDASLFFANVNQLHEEINSILKSGKEEVKAVLLDLESTSELDTDSIDKLIEIRDQLNNKDIEFMLARVHGKVRDIMKRSSLKEMIEEKRIFNSVSDAVLEFKNKYNTG